MISRWSMPRKPQRNPNPRPSDTSGTNVKLLSFSLSFSNVMEALERNNSNVGAGYIERNGEQFLIRAPGQVGTISDLEQVIVAHRGGVPITVKDVAQVAIGKELRTGAATRDGAQRFFRPCIRQRRLIHKPASHRLMICFRPRVFRQIN